jgi:serine phosphatase RsbU (regulator of sigma subunit)
LLDVPPATVLDLVDAKVQHFEMETFATVVCAVAEPPYAEVSITVAGHPPPVVAAPGRAAAFVDVRVSPPVGAGREERRESVVVELPPEGVLVLYTDGLVERRRELLDVGLERLRAAVTPGPAEYVTRHVMHELVSHSTPIDDIALVVLRRTPDS